MEATLRPSWRDCLYLSLLALAVLIFFWQTWIPDPADRARFKPGDFTHIFFPARYYAASHLARGALKASEGVKIIKRDETFAVLQVKAEVPRLLVYVESYYPGWRAEVDGHPAIVYKVNGAFRGVIVPGGEHTVTFRYHPASLYFGAGLSLATLLAFFVYCGFALRGKFAS